MAALVLSALSYAFQAFNSTTEFDADGDETIERWDERFAKLKEKLPVKHGVVGYLADFDVAGIESSLADQEAEYILAQYSMAPIVLARSTHYEWIIGNLSHQAYTAWLDSAVGAYEVTDFRDNLYLIHRVEP